MAALTEEDWPGALSVYQRVTGVADLVSDRRMRLFACAMLRHAGATYRKLNAAVGLLESYADRNRRPDKAFASRLASVTLEPGSARVVNRFFDRGAQGAAIEAVILAQSLRGETGTWTVQDKAIARLGDVVGNPFRPFTLPLDRPAGRTGPTDFFPDGIPFGTCSWLTPDAISLANNALALRDNFTGFLDNPSLLVLADALEEAGCPPRVTCHRCNGTGGWQMNSTFVPCELCDGDVPEHWGSLPHPLLSHLRLPDPHVLGCWAVDVVLGRQ